MKRMLPPVRAGELMHLVDYYVPTRGTNSIGEGTVAFAASMTRIPALVLERSSREVYFARQIIIDTDIVVKMLWNGFVQPSGRLVWERPDGNRTLSILGVTNPDGRRIELEVLCAEHPTST